MEGGSIGSSVRDALSVGGEVAVGVDVLDKYTHPLALLSKEPYNILSRRYSLRIQGTIPGPSPSFSGHMECG